jgi:hypothetical protein
MLTKSLLSYRAEKLEILAVSSMSSVSPMPYFQVYSATKALITNLFTSLHYELKDKGVKVTVVLPGGIPTRPDIIEDIKGQGLWGKLSSMPADKVATKSLKALSKNKVKYISVIIILLVVLVLFLLLFNDLSKEKEINIEEYTQVYMYNLGNSNVEIIKKNDSIILVNSGLKEDLDDLIDVLNKLEIYEIDYLIVTNKDDKYVGNVTYLLDNYLVDYIYMNDYEYSSKIMDEVNSSLVGSYTENIILTSNEIITLDDLTINIYPYMEND